MGTFKKITLGIIPVFLFFGAMAQNEGQRQDQTPQQEQRENQSQQDQEPQGQNQQDDLMHAQSQDFNEPQAFKGEDLEEALLTAGNLREWDNSGDGKFDAAEFYVVLFHIWDRNHDGIINEEEWDYGTGNFLSEYNQEEFGDFKKWNEDGNRELDINEFSRGIERAELYNSSPRAQIEEQGQRMEQEGDMEDNVDREVDQDSDVADLEQDQDLDTTSNQQELGQENVMTNRKDRNYRSGYEQNQRNQVNEEKPSIVIWNRGGVVDEIAIGDRTISLSDNVGRNDSNNQQ